jgi:hypothetical protein
MLTYKQKKVFDENLDSLSEKNNHPSLLEDFFLLRRNGKGTQIESLPGSTGGLSIIEDLFYFERKAARALKVPYSRLSNEDRNSSGGISPTGNDITKEELKFSKFMYKLRRNFNKFFFEMLRRQLIYKNIIKKEEWVDYEKKLIIRYKTNMEFVKAKRLKNLGDSISILRDAQEYVGKYFSKDFIWKKILNFNDQEIKDIQIEIRQENTEGVYKE